MTLQPYPKEDGLGDSADALAAGVPTLSALARLAAAAVAGEPSESPNLSTEAKAILFAARQRGVIEVKGVQTAFEAPQRFLAVYVETDDQQIIAFRNRSQPEITIRFFDAFRQLCRYGLVMHHLNYDFSLTSAGFLRAKLVSEAEVREALEHAEEI